VTHLHDADRDRVVGDRRQAAVERRNNEDEYRMIAADGGTVWVRDAMSVVAKGDVVTTLRGVMVDVTESKRAEEALRESESFYRLLTDSVSDFIRLHDVTGRSIYANQSVEGLYGKKPERLFEFAAYPEDAEAGRQWWERVLAGGEERLNWRVTDGDGAVRWLETRGSIVQYRGTPHVLTVCRDISERTRAEEERQAHLWFLEGMDRVNRAIQGTNDMEQMMRDILDTVLAVFDGDQAGLLYPCDPDANGWVISMVRTRPEYAELFASDPVVEWTPGVVRMIRAVRASDGPVRFGPGSDQPLPELSAHYGTKSLIAMAVHPKGDRPYFFGLAQARSARPWTAEEARLFEEIGRRLAEALTLLSTFRSLRESQAKLDEAARIAHVGYWENDLLADQISWSDETYRILGLQPGAHTPTQRDFEERIHPEDRELQTEATARAQGGDGRYEVEHRIVRPDGEVRNIHSVGEVVRDASGRPTRAFGVVQDITERKRAERTAAESLNLLNAIVEGTSDSIFVKDLEGRYLLFNAAAARNHGKSYDQLVGRNDEELFSPEAARAIVKRDREVLAAGEPQTFEEVVTTGGVARTFVTTKSVFRDASGRTIGLVGISSDVTGLKGLEEQFRQAQKMEAVGRLAGGVAHDFNNLLTVINASSAMLLDGIDDDPSRELIGEIREAGDRAAMLTRQLLAFSRKQVLQSRVVDLNALLDHLLKLLQRLIGEDVEMSLVGDEALELTNIDPGQFEQAIINLAVNARDAMPEGGRLTIETHNADLGVDYAERFPEVEPGRYVLVSVSDTGQGMNEANKARIFEPFFTTKGAGEGTGLGLAMVYGFIKQSGGHIEVSSDVGHGTTFRIYLPGAADATPATELSSEARERATGTETVLLVEDEEAVRRLAHRILQSNGYTVLEAKNGEEASAIAKEHQGPIHILVTDLVMPRMSGRQLATSLVQARPDLRVLFMSGYAEEAVLRSGGRDPSVPFLQKPFSPMDLARKVREVLDAGRPRRVNTG
jgi:PAS domain S-box-containing protein